MVSRLGGFGRMGDKSERIKSTNWPWLVWLSGLSAGLRTKGLLVQFPVRAHAWVAGQVPYER